MVKSLEVVDLDSKDRKLQIQINELETISPNNDYATLNEQFTIKAVSEQQSHVALEQPQEEDNNNSKDDNDSSQQCIYELLIHGDIIFISENSLYLFKRHNRF